MYTAITRSKSSLIICGELEALEMAISKNEEEVRLTTLVEKLTEEISIKGKEMDDTVMEEISIYDGMDKIDPMIGMDGITPYDFMETN